MSNPLKKTMVYLGLADEELEYDEPVGLKQPPPHTAPTAVGLQRPAPVTPLRKTSIHTGRKSSAHEINEILTVHPKHYRDARLVAEGFRDGIPVIINLSQMGDSEARRMIDFASGLSQGLYGTIERVTSKVFLLSPAHIAVSGGDPVADPEVDASLFPQS
jgi:cell division inhibitor SepF